MSWIFHCDHGFSGRVEDWTFEGCLRAFDWDGLGCFSNDSHWDDCRLTDGQAFLAGNCSSLEFAVDCERRSGDDRCYESLGGSTGRVGVGSLVCYWDSLEGVDYPDCFSLFDCPMANILD